MISTPAVASADVLRTMAHELRQPLSTIESIAYYLTLVLPPGDEKVHEQLHRIQQLVEQSNWIVNSAQQLTEPLQATPEQVDLAELIGAIISERLALRDVPELEIMGQLPPVYADPALMHALIENLLSLFRSIGDHAHPVSLRLCPESQGVAIELSTDAPGYRSEASLGPGSTLSLDSVRRIAEAHGGSLDLRVDQATGIRLRVMLP